MAAASGDDEENSRIMLHLASSGLKALCSRITSDGIEACRKACGGHGYLCSSGLPELHGTYLQNCTVEGENYMIAQQTTKQLLKIIRNGMSDTGSSSDCNEVSYLRDIDNLSRLRCQAA